MFVLKLSGTQIILDLIILARLCEDNFVYMDCYHHTCESTCSNLRKVCMAKLIIYSLIQPIANSLCGKL